MTTLTSKEIEEIEELKATENGELYRAILDIMKHEREACARIAEDLVFSPYKSPRAAIADAIRARKP
jgi:hypothetical protein